MSDTSTQSFEVLRQVLEVLEFSGEDMQKTIDKFEKTLLLEYFGAIVKKLPPDQSREIAGLLKEGLNDENKVLAQKKVAEWVNPQELTYLYKKISEGLFSDSLKFLYKSATEEQKQKLEEMFRPEVLKG